MREREKERDRERERENIYYTSKDTTYKIRNHAFLILVYNHPTSLCQDQSMAIATANFA